MLKVLTVGKANLLYNLGLVVVVLVCWKYQLEFLKEGAEFHLKN